MLATEMSRGFKVLVHMGVAALFRITNRIVLGEAMHFRPAIGSCFVHTPWLGYQLWQLNCTRTCYRR
jgi:hypothetical protein